MRFSKEKAYRVYLELIRFSNTETFKGKFRWYVGANKRWLELRKLDKQGVPFCRTNQKLEELQFYLETRYVKEFGSLNNDDEGKQIKTIKENHFKESL